MARVLKPGGRALLLEHSRSRSPLLGVYQDLTNPAVVSMSKGCAWNQDVESLVRQAGFSRVAVDSQVGGLIAVLEARKD